MRNVTLLSGIFVLQPIHHEVSHRPLSVNCNDRIVAQLDRDTQGGSLVTETNVRDIANKIIMPSTVSQGVRDIFGGWNAQRLAGYLLFQIQSPAETKIEMYTVYSDSFDISHAGTLNPKTRFKIDSRRVISSSINNKIMTSTGRLTRDFVNLQPVNVITHGEIDEKDDIARPSDALFQMQKVESGAKYMDSRCKAVVTGTEANAGDVDSGVYLSNIMNAYKLSRNENELSAFGYGDPTVIFEGAACTLKKTHSQESAVKGILERTSFLECGSFEYSELCRQFTNATSVCRTLGSVKGKMENLRNQSTGWHGNDPATNLTYRINDRISKELSCRGIMSAEFSVSQDHTGMPVVAATDGTAMFEAITSDALWRALREIESDIQIFLFSIYHEYCDLISMNIKVTAFSNNFYDVNLDNVFKTSFSAPAFCCGVSSSFMMDNEDDLLNLASGMYGIIEDVYNKEPTQNIVTGTGYDMTSAGIITPRVIQNTNQSSVQQANNAGINFLI